MVAAEGRPLDAGGAPAAASAPLAAALRSLEERLVAIEHGIEELRAFLVARLGG